MKTNETKYRFYIDDSTSRLCKAKLRYIIYGSVILALAITLFILEMFFGFGITKILDDFVSIAMFVDMGIGIIYIVKGILLKSGIRSSFIFNMINSKIEDGKVKNSIGLIKVLSFIPTILNIAIIVFYISTLYYKPDQMSVVLIISFIIGLLIEISTIMAVFSLDSEYEIFDRIE